MQGPLPPAAEGDALPLPHADLVPQMTGLLVASGAVALGVAARRRALKAYEAATDPEEGLRRVADADEADQVGG
ncbi:hypothetical protein QDR37_15840 [Amnibacterium sp. CER49]|uniref:hypothetical protein n=1 Tax=Amnibacterium sp. CER49 TaxID=3039161 RepID=UPI002447DAB1|nr:hypothetical protein [Amnibacterium sp. CER49]MDH2445418.1 hypothetical protein [Amnibacterium sp. CER49]